MEDDGRNEGQTDPSLLPGQLEDSMERTDKGDTFAKSPD